MASGDTVNKWRLLSPEVRLDFLDWVRDQESVRQQQGRLVYGDVFQGDPLSHAIEEALDLLFYLFMSCRQSQYRDIAQSLGTHSPRPSSVEQDIMAFLRDSIHDVSAGTKRADRLFTGNAITGFPPTVSVYSVGPGLIRADIRDGKRPGVIL